MIPKSIYNVHGPSSTVNEKLLNLGLGELVDSDRLSALFVVMIEFVSHDCGHGTECKIYHVQGGFAHRRFRTLKLIFLGTTFVLLSFSVLPGVLE